MPTSVFTDVENSSRNRKYLDFFQKRFGRQENRFELEKLYHERIERATEVQYIEENKISLVYTTYAPPELPAASHGHQEPSSVPVPSITSSVRSRISSSSVATLPTLFQGLCVEFSFVHLSIGDMSLVTGVWVPAIAPPGTFAASSAGGQAKWAWGHSRSTSVNA